MTKLAQQFKAAGIQLQPNYIGNGWSRHNRKAYLRGRFDTLLPLGNVPFNSKVEQVMRGITFGLEAQTPSVQASCLLLSEPLGTVAIAKIRNGVAYPFAGAVTRLASMGLSAGALVRYIQCMRIEGEVAGRGHPCVSHDDDGILYCPVEALKIAAYDLVFENEFVMSKHASVAFKEVLKRV